MNNKQFRWDIEIADENGLIVIRLKDKINPNNGYNTAFGPEASTDKLLSTISTMLNGLLMNIVQVEKTLITNNI